MTAAAGEGSLSSCGSLACVGMEGVDAFAEIIGAAQAAIGLAFELDGERQGRVLGVVEKLLRSALGERRNTTQFLHERVSRGFGSPSETHSVVIPHS